MFEHIPTPPGAPPSVWLIYIPIPLLSLERRLRLPKLPGGGWRVSAIPLVVAGIGLQWWSDRLSRTRGQGTPDPRQPPQVLVEDGPYQYSRNPIWLGRLLLLLGVGLLLRSPLLLPYVVALAMMQHVRIVRAEEPELLERFGSAYEEYCARVPRWLLRLPRGG